MDANTGVLTEAEINTVMMKPCSPHHLTHAIRVSRVRQTNLLTVFRANALFPRLAVSTAFAVTSR